MKSNHCNNCRTTHLITRCIKAKEEGKNDQTESDRVISRVLLNDTIADRHDRIEAVRNGDQRGYLLCTVAASPILDDLETTAIVHDLMRQLEQGFINASSAKTRDQRKLPRCW